VESLGRRKTFSYQDDAVFRFLTGILAIALSIFIAAYDWFTRLPLARLQTRKCFELVQLHRLQLAERGWDQFCDSRMNVRRALNHRMARWRTLRRGSNELPHRIRSTGVTLQRSFSKRNRYPILRLTQNNSAAYLRTRSISSLVLR
jgi:hypothetical protein